MKRNPTTSPDRSSRHTTKAIHPSATEAISAKAVFPEARLAEGIPSIETACPEARPGAHAAESVAATHVAAKPASPSESAMATTAHLRRGRHRRSEQEDCRNDDRRNGRKATHKYIINLTATG